MRTTTALATIAILAAGPALAQSQDISDIAITLRDQGMPVSRMVTIAAFVLGVGLAVAGLLKLAKASERQHDPSNKSSAGWVMILAGAALVALPTVIGSGVETIFGDRSGVIDMTAPSPMLNID